MCRDAAYDVDGRSEYECPNCGQTVTAASYPGDCPECAAPMRNRATPFE
ncbi:Rubrerythrin-like domain-containing protein [Halalkaliarchaeum sp. AArc-CO]|nr:MULTISPECIES: rubrerythrin-like domain-containing protein [unclassified Halalkaliarchaeum]MDR5674059.1 rubrerythrin-like domain-containing protein [Halalkaliarchaeum sp. AArc-GB]UWG50789.1 Rubrerythrin-like domain-containing protein [Halalkaliarchaeum sp. AArc-CO]